MNIEGCYRAILDIQKIYLVMIFTCVGLMLMYLFHTYNNVKFLLLRSDSILIKGKVVEYRKEKIESRNNYTKIYYPYISYKLNEKEMDTLRLRYASSSKKYFEIGEEVDVFKSKGEFLYWDAFDSWYDKLTPSKFIFGLLRSSDNV